MANVNYLSTNRRILLVKFQQTTEGFLIDQKDLLNLLQSKKDYYLLSIDELIFYKKKFLKLSKEKLKSLYKFNEETISELNKRNFI